MIKTSLDASFSLKRVQEMLGLSRTTVTGLIDAGFIAPLRGPRNAYRFSFQDLMLLRTAFSLQQANIPSRKILRSLARLKVDLPAEFPLTGLRITAVGADVTVRDRSGQWQAETGQLVMDFEVTEVAGSVAIMPPPTRTPTPNTHETARNWFEEAVRLELTDPIGAEAAYRSAIASQPDRADSYLNLGAMLCDRGKCNDAVELYVTAIGQIEGEPLLHFNHAIALEDQKRFAQARAAYERALQLDAGLADAHYNLGMLLEAHGDPQGALRHFAAYRRLQKAEGP